MTDANQTNNGKTVAILSYFWLIGWIIALIIHNGNKTSFGAFHLRQAGIIVATQIVLNIIALAVGVDGAVRFLVGVLGFGLFILWIIGLIAAIQGKEKKIPVLGDLAQQWFAGIR